MKRSSALFLSLLYISTACDDVDPDTAVDGLLLASPEGVEPAEVDEVSFREPGPPAALYITTLGNQPIHKAQFEALVNSCWKHGDPPLTCTLSWYKPDKTQPTFVLGLGCSEMATFAIMDCYRTLFLGNGGQAL